MRQPKHISPLWNRVLNFLRKLPNFNLVSNFALRPCYFEIIVKQPFRKAMMKVCLSLLHRPAFSALYDLGVLGVPCTLECSPLGSVLKEAHESELSITGSGSARKAPESVRVPGGLTRGYQPHSATTPSAYVLWSSLVRASV